MNWLVTVHYDPGTPKVYAVLDAPDSHEARSAVLLDIGYHPGVSITCKPLPELEKARNRAHDYIYWRGTPLTAEERQMVRFNG